MMTTMLTESHHDGGEQAVQLLQTPTAQHRVSTCVAAAVRMTVEDDGDITVARIDMAVECGLVIDQVKTETMTIRAAFFAIIPA